MVEYEVQEIEAHQGPDVTFEGRLLGEYSARSKSSTRWTDYEVWETRGGAWIVVIIGRTSEESEQDLYSIKVLAPGDDQTRIIEAMDFMRWGCGPRALAKKLGWNLKVRVE